MAANKIVSVDSDTFFDEYINESDDDELSELVQIQAESECESSAQTETPELNFKSCIGLIQLPH